MNKNHVHGTNKGNVLLYAISTCGWCKKTKRLLNELGVDYYYIDVDLASDSDKDIIEAEVEKWNPRISYPTLVINNQQCILGYQEDEIREAFY